VWFLKPICRLSNFFHFKDRIPLNLRSHVVYQFECQYCNALYLGKTCRHLHTRISEHCRISALTGNPKASFNTMEWWGICPTGPFPLPHHWRKKMAYCPKARALGPVLSKRV
jgi:hypothetical protein